MKTINIGIFAHVDAGKTSIVEQLLFQSKCIQSIGSIKHGDTQMDTMELEKSKGITIQSSITSLKWGDTKINIIDTPGHIDFVAQVYQSVLAVDLAILVVTKIDGIGQHTRMVQTVLKEKKIPYVIFVNKMDLHPLVSYHSSEYEKQLNIIIDQSFEVDKKHTLIPDQNTIELFETNDVTKLMSTHQLTFLLDGSAKNGEGMSELLDLICSVPLSKTKEITHTNHHNNINFAAIVFKITFERGGRVVYLKVLDGTIHKLDKMNAGSNPMKIHKLWIFQNNHRIEAQKVHKGDIACVQLSGNVRIGDIIGNSFQQTVLDVSIPYYEIAIHSTNTRPDRLMKALQQFIIEDPYLTYVSINNRFHLKLFGLTQLDVIENRLYNEFQIIIKIEDISIIKKYAVDEPISKQFIFNDEVNHLPASFTLNVSPNTTLNNSYTSSVSYGYLTKSFQQAVEDGVKYGLSSGFNNTEVIGTKVEMVDAYFDSVLSTPAAFRSAAAILIQDILSSCKLKCLKPVVSFVVEIPTHSISAVLSNLQILNSTIIETQSKSDTFYIYGTMNLEDALNYQNTITNLTSGKGYFSFHFLEFR